MNACMYTYENVAAVGRWAVRRNINEMESAGVLALNMAYHMGSSGVAGWTGKLPHHVFQ